MAGVAITFHRLHVARVREHDIAGARREHQLPGWGRGEAESERQPHEDRRSQKQ